MGWEIDIRDLFSVTGENRSPNSTEPWRNFRLAGSCSPCPRHLGSVSHARGAGRGDDPALRRLGRLGEWIAHKVRTVAPAGGHEGTGGHSLDALVTDDRLAAAQTAAIELRRESARSGSVSEAPGCPSCSPRGRAILLF